MPHTALVVELIKKLPQRHVNFVYPGLRNSHSAGFY